MALESESCAICGCALHRTAGTYALPTVQGRSHATNHHFVAKRFFGRSSSRGGTTTHGVFETCPWGFEGKSAVFCYECHEELLHNPVVLPDELAMFRELVELRGFEETTKPEDRSKLAGRIKLFSEAIARGIRAMLDDER